MLKSSSLKNVKKIILASSFLIAPTLAFSSEMHEDQVIPTNEQLQILQESNEYTHEGEFSKRGKRASPRAERQKGDIGNGTDIDNFTSFWLCEDVGETNPENFYSMRFFEDDNGAYGGNNSIIEFSWSVTDSNNVGFIVPGNPPGNFAFANLEFSDPLTFNAQFEYAGGSPIPTICVLYGLDQKPFGNELPSHGGTTTQTPPTTTNGESLLNGQNIDNFTSYWLCETVGETNPKNFYSMRFFEDGNGAYGANNSILEFSLSVTGSNADFTLPGDSRNIAYANIEFSDQFTFNTQLEITDAPTTPTICVLYDLDGKPFGNDLPSHGGSSTEQPTTPGTTGSVDELLLNVQNSDEWSCTTSNDFFSIVFVADGRGALLTSSNDQAQLKYVIKDDTVVFSINKTADSFFGGIVFSGENNFTSESGRVNDRDIGSVACERVAL